MKLIVIIYNKIPQKSFYMQGAWSPTEFDLKKLQEALILPEGMALVDVRRHGGGMSLITFEGAQEQLDASFEILIQQARQSIADVISVSSPLPFHVIAERRDFLSKRLADLEDVTEKEKEKMLAILEWISDQEFPFKIKPDFYEGIFSGREEGGQYIFDLDSDHIYTTDSDHKFFVRRRWIFDPVRLNFTFRTAEVLQGDEEGGVSIYSRYPGVKANSEIISQIKAEKDRLGDPHLLDVLQVFKSKDPKDFDQVFAPQKIQPKSRPSESRIIPKDTFFNSLPHPSVVKKLSYSSLDLAKNQLDQWKIPYRIELFSQRRKEFCHTLKVPLDQKPSGFSFVEKGYPVEGIEDEEIIFLVQMNGRMFEKKALNRTEGRRGVYEFSFAFGLNQEGKLVENSEGSNSLQQIEILRPEVDILIRPSRAIIVQNSQYPTVPPPNGVEIDGFLFQLTPEQIEKVSRMNSLTPDISSFGPGIRRRYIHYVFEFPPEMPEKPVLKEVLLIEESELMR